MMESFRTQEQPVLIIEADLNSNSTRVTKGKMSIDPAQIQATFAQMEMFGDCGLMFMAFTTYTSQSPQGVTQEMQ